MEKEIKVWLSDVKQAISEIEQFLPEKKMFREFQKDLKSKRAVERNIEIIGEAVNRIVDTRNRISHGYDSVSDDIIWAIVIRDIPKLKMEIDLLLES